MRVFAIFVLMAIGNSSWAIDKNDDVTNISRDSKFIAVSDLTVLANAKKISVAFTSVDNVFQSCSVFVAPAPIERVIKTGTVLPVDRVERVKSGALYPDGYASVIYFDHPEVQALKCFSGEPLSDNHRVPKLHQMERALEKAFKFFPAPATEISGKSICK